LETTKDDLLKKYVVNGAKAIFKKKLVDIGEGNVSIRVPNKMEFLMTPTFNQYEKMTKDDVVHLTFDGEQLSQEKKHQPNTGYTQEFIASVKMQIVLSILIPHMQLCFLF